MRSWSVILGGQSSFDHVHVESLKKFYARSWSVSWGSIIFWPCACWIFKKMLGEILVCHPGGSVIFWPCACWILSLKKYNRPGSHLEFLLKIQHAHGQKMIEPPGWQTRISPRIFLKIQHANGQKMIDPPGWQTRISPNIFLKIQHAHGQKMIDPLADRTWSHLEFF